MNSNGSDMLSQLAWTVAFKFAGVALLAFVAATGVFLVKRYFRARVFDWKNRRVVNRARTVDDLLRMDYYQFEHLCRMLFEGQEYRVTVTSPTNDGGVDLRASKDGRKVFVQCKRYSRQAAGRPEVQMFRGTYSDGQADHGFFITTSRFTREASEFARGKPITLVDRDELAVWINRYASGQLRVEGIVPDSLSLRGRGPGVRVEGFVPNTESCPGIPASPPHPRSLSSASAGHLAVCAACGAETILPFQPTTGKPVYCRACCAKRRRGRG